MTSIAILTFTRIAGCIKEVIGISRQKNTCKGEPERKKMTEKQIYVFSKKAFHNNNLLTATWTV